MFIQCCSKWILKHPVVYEVLDVSFWAEKNGLTAIWHPIENPMPVALKEAYKSFDAGYHEGMDEKIKSETKRGKTES